MPTNGGSEAGRRPPLALAPFDARVHFGKLDYLTADFIALRRELDPAGVFQNDHLRPLFA